MLSESFILKDTNFSPSTLRRRIADGSFPPARQISTRRKAWLEEEYQQWKDDLPVAKFTATGGGRPPVVEVRICDE